MPHIYLYGEGIATSIAVSNGMKVGFRGPYIGLEDQSNNMVRFPTSATLKKIKV